MSLKLLQIADVHLDAPFRWLGTRGREQRLQLKETFRRLIDLALAERIDALLVAGDLFDSNTPAQDTIDLVRAQLARLACPVFLLPGTHDCFDATSVYRRPELAQLPNVRLFDAEHSAFAVDTLELAVQGQANCSKTSPTSPLRGLSRRPGARYNVALAHGSLAMPGTEDDFPLAPADFAAAGMDYVALGHWHSQRVCQGGRACYSGPPELLAEGQEGCALLVELGEGAPRLEARDVARRRCAQLELAVDGLPSAAELAAAIRARGDPDLAQGVTLVGLRPLDLVLDLEALARELEGDFFALRLEDRSHPALAPDEIAALPEGTVLGRFARLMGERLAAASEEAERRTAEQALQIGLALLQGRRVL